jgi:sodium/bile acid cotransporter 7
MEGTKFFSLLKRVGIDGFIIALIAMIVIAWFWPYAAVSNHYFSLPAIANYGVSLIFFFYGLRLKPAQLKAGLGQWKLHVVIQMATFLLFPLIVLSIKPFILHTNYQVLWVGVFFLASLPSTVSSSVVMVSIARGNMAAAIFNASISSLLGVFLTPLWMSLEIESGSGGIAVRDTIMKLFFQIILPVIAGILLHNRLGAFAEKHKKKLRWFDQTIILLIVYTSFADSFLQKRFAALTLLSLLVLSLLMIVLFFLVYMLVRWVCRLLKFSREDTIAAVFCGSKKSLVHGSVMVKLLFGGTEIAGIMLLPIMIYHAAQLIIASFIAQKESRR